MLIARDYVGYMATEVVKRLVEGKLIETKVADAVAQRLRQRMMEEITVEDRLNEEVRQILTEHQEEMRRSCPTFRCALGHKSADCREGFELYAIGGRRFWSE